MKLRLPIILLVLFLYSLMLSKPASAQFRFPQGSLGTSVGASIGELYLTVSGYVSPYASIVLTNLDGVFLRSGVADANGNFYISQVLIRRGFLGFCLSAYDFHRLGESTTCFRFPPAQSDIVMRDLFLPPTLGLYKKEIKAGESALVFGYTMPGATVTLYLSNGKTFTVTANASGYYEFKISELSPGDYKLHSLAVYQGKESLKPSKEVDLKALSLPEGAVSLMQQLLDRLGKLFTSIGLGPLWLAIPILILIFILLKKLWPDTFRFIPGAPRLPIGIQVPSFKKKLHHWWMEGVGY